MPRARRRFLNPGPRPAGRRGRPPTLGVAGAVSSLQRYRAELLAQRDGLDGQINALDQALSAIGATPVQRISGGVARVGRPRKAGGPRPGSLKDYILNALRSGGVMAVKDITSAVLSGGYATKNKTLAKSVGIALAEMKNHVQKVGRGRFRAK